MQEYLVDKYNLFNLIFIKNKKNYSILIKDWQEINGKKKKITKKVLFKTPLMTIPFGIEKYFFKDIINLEFLNYEKDNICKNFYSLICQIDNFMSKILWNNKFQNELGLEDNFINELKNKKYLSCIKIRPNNFDPLLRTHLSKKGNQINTQFFTEDIDKKKSLININNLEKKIGYFVIELSSLWINNDNYGLTWIIKAGKIIK